MRLAEVLRWYEFILILIEPRGMQPFEATA
jgi:hypothetical protein